MKLLDRIILTAIVIGLFGTFTAMLVGVCTAGDPTVGRLASAAFVFFIGLLLSSAWFGMLRLIWSA